MLKAPIFMYNTLYKGFAAGHIGCQIFAFVGSLSGIGAGMTNAFIAYDRCSTITSPLDKRLTKTKAFLIILFIWSYTIPWAVLPLLEIWSRFVPGTKVAIPFWPYILHCFFFQRDISLLVLSTI